MVIITAFCVRWYVKTRTKAESVINAVHLKFLARVVAVVNNDKEYVKKTA